MPNKDSNAGSWVSVEGSSVFVRGDGDTRGWCDVLELLEMCRDGYVCKLEEIDNHISMLKRSIFNHRNDKRC
jgi:hypothetical protein